MRTILLLLFSVVFIPLIQSQDNPDYFQTTETGPGFINSWAFSVKFNTFGPGAEIATTLGESFSLRFGGNYLAYDFSTVYEDMYINASADLSVGAISLLADWYMSDKLHLTGGMVYNLSKESVSGKPTEEFTVGTLTVKPDEIGSMTLTLEPNRIAPYLALGFGRPVPLKKSVSVNFELGAVYHGKPKVGLDAQGMIAPTANEDNEKAIEDNISSFSFFPVLSFQIAFKLN